MRTVFWDGSPTANPREITALFPSASVYSYGSVIRPRSYVQNISTFSGSGIYPYSPPCLGAFLNIGTFDGYNNDLTIPLTGADVRWFSAWRSP